MTSNYVLYALYDDTINTSELADLGEIKLQEQPANLALRAHLLHYFYKLETRLGQREVNEARLRHIKWFIENHPDLEFCGTAPFYDKATSSDFGLINTLWQESISDSQEEMRKVNACMNLANSDRPAALKLMAKLFTPGSDSLWVLALRDLLCNTGSSFSSVVAAERINPEVMDNEFQRKLSTELKENTKWEYVALQDLESRGYDATNVLNVLSTTPCSQEGTDDYAVRIFNNHFSSSMSLRTAARIAGSTYSRFESNSVLGFNPVALSLRFQLASWITRHLPFSKLAINHIFVAPFNSPRSHLICDGYFKPVECLYDYLAELWISQISKFPTDRKIASNAANLTNNWEGYFPRAAGALVSKLSETSAGRVALEKRKTR
jgi:hypothetical protein